MDFNIRLGGKAFEKSKYFRLVWVYRNADS